MWIDPPALAATPLSTYGQTIGVIVTALLGISGAAFGIYQKIHPILGQNKRDKALTVDYEAMQTAKRETEAKYTQLQARYDQLVTHVIKLKGQIGPLTDSNIQLSLSVDSLCLMISKSLADKPDSAPFILVLDAIKDNAQNTKIRAQETAALANAEILMIDAHIDKHTLETKG